MSGSIGPGAVSAPGDPSGAAAAEHLMAAYRLQQADDTHHAGHGLAVSRAVRLVCAVMFGAAAGGLLGAVRGHAIAGAFWLALVGAMLEFIRQRRF